MTINVRVFVFDADTGTQQLLRGVLENRGYNVKTFSEPKLCERCACSPDETCVDIIISDNQMSSCSGLKFARHQLSRDCKVAQLALISEDWTAADLKEADALACQTFSKPIDQVALGKWLDRHEKTLDPNRTLRDHFVKARVKPWVVK